MYQALIAIETMAIDQSAVMPVFVMMGRHDLEAGTFLPGLPESLGCYDAVSFSYFVFCQYDTVTVLRAAADRHGFVLQVRIVYQLYRCVEPVHITVEDDSVHIYVPFLILCRLVIIIISLKALKNKRS